MWYNGAMDYYKDEKYMAIVGELIDTPEIQHLKQYTQHHYGTRYDHVIAVSYLSYRMALYMGLDATSVARAGILHDYYYYDWHDEGMSMSKHALVHPQVALTNAKQLTSVNKLEEEIILTHMYPAGGGPKPTHMAAWLVDAVDDYLASTEGMKATLSGAIMSMRFGRHRRIKAIRQTH